MEAYSNFDFEANKEFQHYLSNIFPVPVNVEKYKRNWYKKYIDPNFDANDKQQSQKQEQSTNKQEEKENQQQQQQQKQQQQQQQQQQQSQSQQKQNFQRQTPQLPISFVIEGVLKVLYFPALLFLQKPELHKYVNLGSVLICLMALKRIRGIPKKGEYQEYFAKSLRIEFATNIFYMIALFAIDNIVFQLPIALHFLVGAAELWTQLSQDEGFTLRFAYYIVKNRDEILITKQKIEIYLFFYSVIGVFLRKTSLFLGVFIFQNILLKTKCNQKMMIAQSNIKDWYRSNLLENSKVPQPLQKLLGLIWIGYEKLITIF